MENTPEKKESILEEASRIIYGDREKTYGDPAQNLKLIANFWSSYIAGKPALDIYDVCNMMCLLKLARRKTSPQHRDSLVDEVGYILLQERCWEAQNKCSVPTDPGPLRGKSW